MKSFLAFLLVMTFLISSANFAQDKMTLDFGYEKVGQNWRVINDGVMGGLSQGSAVLTENSIQFTGDISLKNNGGFSSLKAPFAKVDLSTYSGFKIRYRQQGHPVAMTFEWHPRFYRYYHKVLLPETNNTWNTVTIPFKSVKQYRLGTTNGKSISTQDLQKIIRLGFIASEKQESTFDFEVDYIIFQK